MATTIEDDEEDAVSYHCINHECGMLVNFENELCNLCSKEYSFKPRGLEIMPNRRKPIAIDGHIVLCDDGTLWKPHHDMIDGIGVIDKWERLPDIPQED